MYVVDILILCYVLNQVIDGVGRYLGERLGIYLPLAEETAELGLHMWVSPKFAPAPHPFAEERGGAGSPRGEALGSLPNARSWGRRAQITPCASRLLSNQERRLVLEILAGLHHFTRYHFRWIDRTKRVLCHRCVLVLTSVSGAAEGSWQVHTS